MKPKKETDIVNRLTVYPFGRISVRLNMEYPKATMMNFGDVRTARKNKRDLQINVKGPDGMLGYFYLARSKLAKIETMELEIREE